MSARECTVPPQARGERLDQFLSRTFADLSRSRLKALIEQGQVLLNGHAISKAAQRLEGGELIALRVPEPTPSHALPEALGVSILYQDRDLLVLDKAAGMAVHPGAGRTHGTLVNALLHHVKDLAGVGGELRPGIVHRLDKDTSGCLVVAKNDAALAGLQRAFKGREVEKTYLAIVHGVPNAEGRIETLYGRHPVHRQRFSSNVRTGKRAVTHYRLLERFDSAALVEVGLETGRTHQIRVHLADLGFPLLGDLTYGRGRQAKGKAREAQERIGRQALHAWKLRFEHPRTGRTMAFEAPPPADFTGALEILKGVL